MKKEQRNALLDHIITTVNQMTEEESNQGSIVTIGGHEVRRRLLYAGCSQWCGCGRDWDETQSGWGWVIDDRYILTQPKLGGFNGHNMIERQTGYYLQDGFDEQSCPEHDGRAPLDRAPNYILVEIGHGLVEAQRAVAIEAGLLSKEADVILAELAHAGVELMTRRNTFLQLRKPAT